MPLISRDGSVRPHVSLAHGAAPTGDVPTGVDRLDEARDVLGRVLQVTVHGDDDVAPCPHDPRVHGGVLAEVPLQPDGVDARIPVMEALERGKRPVRRAVVDEHDLERAAQPCQRQNRPSVELVDRLDLVEQRDDDRDLRPRLTLGLSRLCPQDVKLLHRSTPAYTP